MSDKPYNILFLCTGNSARSIMAEGLVTHLSGGRFKGYSAGSYPAGVVNPFAIQVLKMAGCETGGMFSKSWDQFAGPDAPKMDFVITVCDNAAGEACPVWPGTPVTAHWGFPDPSHIGGSDEHKLAAFSRTSQAIAQRLRLFLSLPIDKLDAMSLQSEIRSLGSTG